MRAIALLIFLHLIPTSLPADEVKKPTEGWKEYTPRDGSFSVMLPDMGGRRSERERTLLLRGSRIKLSVVQLQLNDGPTLSASSIALPLPLTRIIAAQEKIEIVRDAIVETVTGKIEAEKEIMQGGLSGREYTVTTGQGVIRLRLFALGSRIFEATVTGSKEQVQSKEANAFLDSLRPAPRGNAEETDKLVGKAVTVLPGEMFTFLESALKEKRTADAGIKGYQLGKNLYRDTVEKGGVLIGFNVGLKQFLKKDIVAALQPIYLTKDGEVTGQWYGPKPTNLTTMKAKTGYVVVGIKLRTTLSIEGFSLSYVKLGKDRIQMKDTYSSEWVGSDRGEPATLGGQGYFFVGVRGHFNSRGDPGSIGLITILVPKE